MTTTTETAADLKRNADTKRGAAITAMWQIMKDADREKLALALMPNGYTRAEADALIGNAIGSMIQAQSLSLRAARA